MIEINKLSKYYGKFLAVDSIDMNVLDGQIYGFVGKNGAGKSTTIRTLLGLISPSSGIAKINGLDIVEDVNQIHKRISYVPSDVVFYENIKVKDMIKFALSVRGNYNYNDVLDMCKKFDLDINRKINELSFGNKKKVSIVIALLQDADVYILDEPTNGLDPLIQDVFFNFLLKQKELGKTIFLSSHNLSDVEKYCDYVSIIKDGKIVSDFAMIDLKRKQKKHIQLITSDGNKEEYDYDGDINKLIKELSKKDITSLEITTISLESLIKDYYEGD